MSTSNLICDALYEVLSLDKKRIALDSDTALFGSLPELDSMSLMILIEELEQRFTIEIDEDDVSAENFATVASLTALVESKQA